MTGGFFNVLGMAPLYGRTLLPEDDAIGGPTLLLLATACGFGLVLTRALGRTRELAIRSALGAGRMRLVPGVLVDSVVLAGVGGAGLGLAFWASQGIAALEDGLAIPLLGGTRIDPVPALHCE